MKVIFLGVGEACDENLPNNSHLILSDTTLLLDCGYSVPRQLWKYNPDPSFLDAIYISHRHADHYFGIPALLVRMWEEKRKKPLTIICQKELKTLIEDLIIYGYKGLLGKFEFKLKFLEINEEISYTFNELTLEFAPTIHSVNNLAIKISDGQKVVCYSGDGMFNKKTEALYNKTDLVIHESYTYDQTIPGHASIIDLIVMAKRKNIKCLALTHLQRNLRREKINMIRNEISTEEIKIILPESLEDYSFQ